MPEHERPGPTAVDDWFARRTLAATEHDPAELAARKDGLRVAAVLPARDEEATVGDIVRALGAGPLDRHGLLDEIVVVDSHSRDATADVAAAAGARVVRCTADPQDGKGGAIRSGLAGTDADLVVFLDADVESFREGYVTGLLAPLLDDPTLALAKAFYDRPFRPEAARGVGDGASGGQRANGGGRVTELVARPSIAERAPELAGFAQPLAGEYAVRRRAVAGQPVVSGYGVDLGHLLLTWRAHGLDAMCQVDLGHRTHRHHDLDALGRMAAQVRAAFLLCLDGQREVRTSHTRFARDAQDRLVRTRETVTTRLLAPVGR
ncbi:glucosyl-3-phosphoglycerate synthase [Aeromicrobium sp.]|uniref:glucosyl-3-phosphoglycerate synthase n=1 Tax=Aeromicrobium sp. TaxID=1871063 RepID=UPI0025C2C0BC|nr:glucosyl-3-phosphoglycerate synthase [Aeromicrobium sp.]MCK5892121.1 glucosyl-3-phosphoglycerate synthase [Aeromicrobium sp.]